VKRIIGGDRVEAIEAVQVDEHWNYVEGTEELIPCDTLLLSVGLIPENELSQKAGVTLDPLTAGPIVDAGFQTSVPGIFAAGNVVHVYDIVDWVTKAGLVAGREAAQHAMGQRTTAERMIPTAAGDNVRYVVPHQVNPERLTTDKVALQFRVTQPIEQTVRVRVHDGDELLTRKTARYARPGEMMEVTLRGREYDAVREAQALKVSVVQK
jgi:hypothetical protein